ncbi:MAG: iron-containing alcohol dehydrogenase [Clostridia bacterium]|nr:iron-containing alcohol dehydrogenase [Clostridia bacterium]
MNAINRLRCRAFQAICRVALPFLPYRQPKLLGRLRDIAPLLRQKKIASVLLIADAGIRELGLTAPLERSLERAHIACVIHTQHNPIPNLQDIEDACKLYNKSAAKAIIAIGGGSAIDCAKVAGARIARPTRSVTEMAGILRVMRRTPLLIAIPSAAGTGAEATLDAVITDDEHAHPYSILDFSLIPEYNVFDAQLSLHLSPRNTAIGAMDALTHAVEAYIGRSTNKFTRAMAEEAVMLLSRNMRPAYENGSNLRVRQRMLRASYCAGVTFTRSYIGYVHAIAHTLSAEYGIEHGLANAVVLPHMLRHYGLSCSGKLARLAYNSDLVSRNVDENVAARRFIRWIEKTNKNFGFPSGFSQIREEDIPEMARIAAKEANPLYPVPQLMDACELEVVYRKLMIKEEPET